MDFLEEIIRRALPALEEDQIRAVVTELMTTVGVEEPVDLQLVKEDDIKHLLTPIQTRKVLLALKTNGKIPHFEIFYCNKNVN